MTLIAYLLGAGLLLELAFEYVPFLWRARRVLALVAMLLTAFASGMLASYCCNVATVLFLTVSLYRVFNMLRVGESRMHEAYLKRALRRTSRALAFLQLLLVAGWWGWHQAAASPVWLWTALGALQVSAAAIFLWSLTRTLKHTHWPGSITPMADTELPTVTVAVPARNETEDLEACLRSLLASDYPKLEIIVLDDCSQTKRTSEIIRGFAHDGVRFVQGAEPSDTWLPKTQAYARLADEASGAYILFCGVDVRFGTQTLRQLMAHVHAKNKEMVSILPLRPEAAGSALTQALRYWWELVPPRRQFQRPPVLSTCWIIDRKALEHAGGFEAVARAITPEAYFAREAASHDAYGFLRANAGSGLTSLKTKQQQRDTAIRISYPQLHRRPENVAVLALFELGFLVLPFALVIVGLSLGMGWLAWALAVLASVLLALTYRMLTKFTRTAGQLSGGLGLPVAMLYNIVLVHASMWQYEFSVVEWKGRNICIPAMHVIPHLPKID
jgi:hypothetical protein